MRRRLPLDTGGFPGRTIRLCIAVVFFVLLGGCEESPDEARFKLGQLGYQFTPFSLLQAANQNDHVAVNLLILAGMDPDTVLDRSVVNSEYARLGTDGPEAWTYLAKRGAHTTALGIAALNGHTETVGVLLEAGANLDKRDSYGMTPLMRAMEGGHVETTEALLDADAEVGEKDFKKSVTKAAANNNVVMLNLLMNLSVDVSIRNEVSVTALMEAASEGGLDVVAILIEAGTDVDAQRDRGRGDTALIQAARRGKVDVVRLLLESGADPNLKNNEGTMALVVASANGYTEIVRLLLDAGADPNTPDNNGGTALTWATGQIDGLFLAGRGGDRYADTVRVLLDAGADPNRPGRDGVSAFMTAFEKRNVAVIEAMFEAGADPDVQDEAGNNLLMQGLLSNSIPELVHSLIQRVSDAGSVNHQNKAGVTALMIAARRGPGGAVQALLAAGADANTQTPKGTTALMIAAANGHQSGLTALLEAGADPTLKSSSGKTALDQVSGRMYGSALRQMKGALRDAMNRWQAPPTPSPVGKAAPVAAPVLEIETGPNEDLANEIYLGGMKRRGMKVYALSKDGNWCAENVVFKITAPSDAVFTDGTAEFYMKRFGERINEEQFCPAARSADIYGYTDGGTEAVFTGKATAAAGWSVN